MANAAQLDGDADLVGDACDPFPNNPAETADSDADGVGDNTDLCPADSNKVGPGVNGCSVSDVDELLVGGWWTGASSTATGEILSISFYPNGTYIHGQNGDDVDPRWIGIEYGTYSVNPETNDLIPWEP